jgi:HPt (histidine-containing phosphotransfer) domain-containing protein
VLARERFNAVLMGARPAAPRIDTRCGVANTGGNGVLFRRMLGLIRARETDFVQRFRAARAARAASDHEAATRAAHDLEGVAGILGVHALQQAADVLERACVDRSSDLEEPLGLVSRHIDEVLEEIEIEFLEATQVV